MARLLLVIALIVLCGVMLYSCILEQRQQDCALRGGHYIPAHGAWLAQCVVRVK